ncbi:hypothetical protein COHA_003443 [Chlorella ohadii]|uniref:Uncharacterized protein n=1 Tax=Chlorella ohadii TaxID=2649997 RepID=A0AAD5DV12_9CHLO|nr:hypothetical protein COHA_003443 [Chlorella ohadii]
MTSSSAIRRAAVAVPAADSRPCLPQLLCYALGIISHALCSSEAAASPKRSFCTKPVAMLSWDDEDDCYLESLESLKQASASFELHESASCAALLPCGLLPEELEELESLKLEADLLKSPASPAAATLKSITIATSGSGDAPAPVTPQGMTPFSGAARLLSDAEDEEVTEEPADDPEEDGGDVCADMVPACRP